MFSLSCRKVLQNLRFTRYIETSGINRYAFQCQLKVTPSTSLVDEEVEICLDGLKPGQMVTLVANVEEKGHRFESTGVYQADETGQINNMSCESVGGSFTGKQPMGLFWSLKSSSGGAIHLISANVSKPLIYNIKAYPGVHESTPRTTSQPIAETNVSRLYKYSDVKIIQQTDKFKGVIFLPEGAGPFPGLIDMNVGLLKQIESRAALLASHGYATFALSYRSNKGSPNSSEFRCVQEACEWFIGKKYIKKDSVGAVGASYGGSLALFLASINPQVRAAVNVSGISVFPQPDFPSKCAPGWPAKEGSCLTEEGVDCRRCYECNDPWVIPAWKFGAKILTVIGDDDRQFDPKCISRTSDKCPEEFKENISIYRYPGAGHFINPPYTPLLRTLTLGREHVRRLLQIPEQFHGEDILLGGQAETHAYAQEDSWQKILEFLNKNLD